MSDNQNTCLIRQPAGIGDIIFTHKIAKLILKKGDYKKIIWPVIKEYSYINDYIGTENIIFCDESLDFAFKDMYNSENIEMVAGEDDNGHKLLYIPLQHADQCERALLPDYRAHGQMKYKYVGIASDNDTPWHNWRDFIEIRRNPEREAKLVSDLGVDLTQKYNFVNRNYGSPPNWCSRDDIIPDNDLPCVFMMMSLSDYHIFDWLSIMDNATNIYTMETSVCYLAHYLHKQNVNVYSKYTIDKISGLTNGYIDDFTYINGNYSSEWTYHS